MERDTACRVYVFKHFISTHTLTWSVTYSWFASLFFLCISTHTLTWSVTCRGLTAPIRPEFQLTRSRGAWLHCFHRPFLRHKFQLTRSRGAWPPALLRYVHGGYFNSHAHVERDHRSNKRQWFYCHFNSHAHVERDGQNSGSNVFPLISTHTLTWSVTFFKATLKGNNLFQLTRSRGAWHFVIRCQK